MSRCWLTGASSGLGAALAQALLEQGHQVALGGRRSQALLPLAERYPGQVLLAEGDIADAAQVAQMAARIEQAWGGLDMAVFNAGTCEYLEPGHFDPALVERVVRTNLLGVSNCLAAALPLLRAGVRPHLVVVGSSVTWLALPRAGAYGVQGSRALPGGVAADRLGTRGYRRDVGQPGLCRYAVDPPQRLPHAATVVCRARGTTYCQALAPAPA